MDSRKRLQISCLLVFSWLLGGRLYGIPFPWWLITLPLDCLVGHWFLLGVYIAGHRKGFEIGQQQTLLQIRPHVEEIVKRDLEQIVKRKVAAQLQLLTETHPALQSIQ